jgi:hypothetical protein
LTFRVLYGDVFLPCLHLVDKVKEDELGRTCSTNGDKWNIYRILVGKPERKRQLGRPRYKVEDSIIVDLR